MVESDSDSDSSYDAMMDDARKLAKEAGFPYESSTYTRITRSRLY